MEVVGGCTHTMAKRTRTPASKKTSRRTAVNVLTRSPPSPATIAPSSTPMTKAAKAIKALAVAAPSRWLTAKASRTELPVMFAVKTWARRYVMASTLPAAQVKSSTVTRRRVVINELALDDVVVKPCSCHANCISVLLIRLLRLCLRQGPQLVQRLPVGAELRSRRLPLLPAD